MSPDQPTSTPPPGASSLWGSYSGSGASAPAKAAPRAGGGADPRPSALSSLVGGEPLDPLSRKLMDGVKFLALLLVLVLANSFLNGSGDSENRLEFNPVAAAAERTQNEPGARFSMKAIYTSPALPQAMVAHGSGSINSQTGRSRAVLSVDSPKGPVRVETVSDGTTTYMRGTGISGELPGGKEWLAMQPFLGHSEQDAMVGGSGDPEGALQMLTAVDGSFEELGREKVRGVPTRRYRTSVSLSGYAELLRDEGKDELADHYEKLSTLMPGPVVGEAWIDDKGIVRRNRVVMDLPGESGQPAMTMDMQMDLFDFGARPQIGLPDSSQVFDATPYVEEQFDEIESS
ncbi:MAG TPA: hypothetical protein VF255_07785 [Solirubrobacterales bacterium]